MKVTAQILENGRITIPKHVRDALDVDEKGALVEVEVKPVEGGGE